MEPHIQYCRTAGGYNVAYFAVGAGPPLLVTPPHLNMSIARSFEVPSLRRIIEASSRFFTYITFDPHGCGSSQRDVSDFSVDSFVADLEAVADSAAPGRFALFANGAMTAPAIVYAARHPDRLTHLILWMVATNRRSRATLANKQMADMALIDWRLATESGMRAVDNWEHDELASQMAAMMRESVTPETYVQFEHAAEEWDVAEYLPRVATPTLVIHPRNHPYFPTETAQAAAAAIPGARLALMDSATVLFPDTRITVVAGEFLGSARRRPAPTAPPREVAREARAGTAVILFTDIADSTALTERMGDAAFREASRALDGAIRAAMREAGGAPVEGKVLGDGVMGVFASAAQAIAAARASVAAADAAALSLHVGLHAGDVIREGDNVYGGAVNIASRICGLSAPGEVLVSATVRDLARTSAGVVFEDRGEHALKGIADAVRVYAVRASSEAGA